MSFRLFPHFIFLSSLLLLQSLVSCQDCVKGRLTQYTIFALGGVPQGTCNFGSVSDKMPEEFRSGRIIAANQDYYNGFVTNLDFMTTCNPQNGTSCGLRCGECVMVTGARGSASYIIGDIGDYTNSGIENVGDMTQFALNNYQNQAFKQVADDPGYELMTFRPVPCSTTGNIGFFYPESGSNKFSVALTFYNYKVQIQSVEVLGVGQSVNTTNEWAPLIRQWNNKFVWRGVENFAGQSGDIYNGGFGYKLRVTSVFGEVIESSTIFGITHSNTVNTFFDLEAQFKVSKYIPGGGCLWSGPNPEIYADKVSTRKFNKLKKSYDKCPTNPNCRTFLEGKFLVEWYLIASTKVKNLDLEYSGNECKSRICIEVTSPKEGGELLIGHSSDFFRNDYSNVTFKAKIVQNSGANSTNLTVTFGGCDRKEKFEITTEWNQYNFTMKFLKCPDYIKVIKFTFSEVDFVYLDDIILTGPNSLYIDPTIRSIGYHI